MIPPITPRLSAPPHTQPPFMVRCAAAGGASNHEGPWPAGRDPASPFEADLRSAPRGEAQQKPTPRADHTATGTTLVLSSPPPSRGRDREGGHGLTTRRRATDTHPAPESCP